MRRDSADLIENTIHEVISVGHIYLTSFNVRKGHFSQKVKTKLCLFQIYICEANNATE